jgi:hypothetical protein
MEKADKPRAILMWKGWGENKYPSKETEKIELVKYIMKFMFRARLLTSVA